MNTKASRNQIMQQKFHQGLPQKILRTILKMDKGQTQTNNPKYKKADNYAQGFMIRDDMDRLSL